MKKSRKNHGFTMAEMLAVVAIIGVLLLLAGSVFLNIYRSSRQRKLDDCARQVYLIAQQELSARKYSGRLSTLSALESADGAKKLTYTPSDASDDLKTSVGKGDIALYSFTSKDTNLREALLPDDATPSELLDAYWVVEYDHVNGNVYAVYYAEKEAFNDDENVGDAVNDSCTASFDALRDEADGTSGSSARVSLTKATVGYYGGSEVWEGEAKELDMSVSVVNEEQLQLVLSYNEPRVKNDSGDYVSDKVKTVSVTVTDTDTNKTWTLSSTYNGTAFTSTNAAGLAEVNFGDPATDVYTGRQTTALTLDSMLDGQGFSDITGLAVGDNIRISVTVTTNDGVIGEADVSTNSGFAAKTQKEGKSSQDEVTVAYGRHLQNLGRYVTTRHFDVVQTQDITFSETADSDSGSWYELYVEEGNLTFTPVTNDWIVGFDGQEYTIAGLTVHTGEADETAGLFGVFTGTSLANIRIEDPKIEADKADAYVGAIAGRTNALATLENCFVSLSTDQARTLSDGVDQLDDVNCVLTGGKYAGGLIGYVYNANKTELTVKNCMASVPLRAADGMASRAGGLIGALHTEGAVTLDACYSSGYLFAGKTAGLIYCADASQKLSIKNCYAAGFTKAGTQSAGLVLFEAETDSGLSIAHAYSVVRQTLTDTSGESWPISNVKKTTANEAVYYMGSGADETLEGTAVSDLESEDFLEKLGGSFTFANGTTPYNLMDNGLSDYTYPMVTVTNYLEHKSDPFSTETYGHVGDWRADFSVGLVYYEKYKDGTYGIYGSGISALKRSDSNPIVEDGYAFALSDASETTVSVRFSGGTDTEGAQAATASVSSSARVTSGGTTYVLALLNEQIDKKLGKTPLTESFYYAIEVNDRTYFFNPYFARTVRTVSTVVTGDTAKSLKPETVYVSTARQLNRLSEYETYWDYDGISFYQDCDIDYASYKGYGGSYDYNYLIDEDQFNKTSGVALQTPIGTEDTPFALTYDGDGHTISGVNLAASAPKGSATAVGLFGKNTGTVKNLTLNGHTDDGDGLVYGITGDTLSGSRTKLCLGALVGDNAGRITNCAVTGYSAASGVTGKTDGEDVQIRTYTNSRLYVGGLAGSNTGSISKCSADVPLIQVNSTSAYAYGGSFVGYNSGNISKCYGFGRIHGSLATSLSAQYGGFAGYNSGEVKHAYCAASIVVGGRASKSAFAKNKSGSLLHCSYLADVDGSYYGNIYAYASDSQSGVTAVTSFSKLKKLSVSGFSSAKKTTETEQSGDFPYPAVVTRDGKTVSVGNWPVKADLGDVGVVYWEHETGGSNDGWYFTTLDKDGKELSTLCDEHDDGGSVESYGYGYFSTAADDGSASWDLTDSSYLNLGKTIDGTFTEGSAQRNTTAESALHSAMPEYVFEVYTSGTSSSNLKLTSDSTNGTYQTETSTSADYEAITPEEFEAVPGSGDTRTTTDGNTTTTWYRTSTKPSETTSYSTQTETEEEDVYPDELVYADGSAVLQYGQWNWKQWGKNWIKTADWQDITFSAEDDGLSDLYVCTTTDSYYKYNNYRKNGDKVTVYDWKDLSYFALKRVETEAEADVTIKITGGSQNGTIAYYQFGYVDKNHLNFTRLTLKTGDGVGEGLWYTRMYRKSTSDSVVLEYQVTTQSASVEYYYYKKTVTTLTEYTPTASSADYQPNGSITLTSSLAETDAQSHTFVINPFFGNSLALAKTESATSGTKAAIDTLGKGDELQYEVRSLDQLQLINWNALNKNATTYIQSSNYTETAVNQSFLYQSYFENQNTKNSKDTGAEFCWEQTHDLNGGGRTFSPIGSLYDKNNEDDADVYLDCFSGTYNGGQYQIADINIYSGGRQCVGLFGITRGATLKNIVLRSESGKNVICTETNDSGWYNLGGLVGFATIGSSGSSISNCCVSGYQIVDKRANNGDWGGGNVGGLVGATNMKLTKCTAANTITINVSYKGAGWKNLRVGGLVGGLRNDMSECYSGGEIVIGEKTKAISGGITSTTSVWIGGIAGGIVMKTGGLTKDLIGAPEGCSTTTDKSPTLTNCYTYTKLPEIAGVVRSVQSIASIGEFLSSEFSNSGSAHCLTMKNCYCLAANASNAEDYKTYGNTSSWDTQVTLGGRTHNNVKRYIYLDNSEHKRTPYLTYDEMKRDLKALLGGDYATVTTKENGISVNGKYSYNIDSALDGGNYPFPTILKQDGSNVHYGDWPTTGILADSEITIDMLADWDKDTQTATKNLNVKLELEDQDVGTGGILTVSSGEDEDESLDDMIVSAEVDGLTVKLTAKEVGSATLKLTYTADNTVYEWYVTVNVTADISLTLPESLTIKAGEEQNLDLGSWKAYSGTTELTGGEWTVTASGSDLTVVRVDNGDGTTSTVLKAAAQPEDTQTTLAVEYTWTREVTQDGKTVTQTFTGQGLIPVTIETSEEDSAAEGGQEQ